MAYQITARHCRQLNVHPEHTLLAAKGAGQVASMQRQDGCVLPNRSDCSVQLEAQLVKLQHGGENGVEVEEATLLELVWLVLLVPSLCTSHFVDVPS
mmetsp:Transcript_34416/g.77060  ORF Transcript_34416/g.77060 Transcript_34416/m.77060 type:complete len:97 (+) Transcript_34416:27-317(+)